VRISAEIGFRAPHFLSPWFLLRPVTTRITFYVPPSQKTTTSSSLSQRNVTLSACRLVMSMLMFTPLFLLLLRSDLRSVSSCSLAHLACPYATDPPLVIARPSPVLAVSSTLFHPYLVASLIASFELFFACSCQRFRVAYRFTISMSSSSFYLYVISPLSRTCQRCIGKLSPTGSQC
jgi:hypothetical protein